MNIKRSGQYILIILALACGITACKKDKPADPAPEPVEVVAISVENLKALAKDEAVTVPDGRKIAGIVISDGVGGKNIAATSLVLQEETGKPGIIVNLAATHSFKVGDKVEINISKQKLEKLNGEVTLTGIPVANVTQAGTGTITAKVTTVEELTANVAAWDGTLVQLGEGRFYGGNGKYTTDGVEYADNKGRVKIGVAGTAVFKDQVYAASVNQLVGIVRLEGTKARLDIRNTGDVTGGAITQLFVEDFSDISFMVNPVSSEFIGDFTTAVEDWGYTGSNNAVATKYLLQGNRFDGDFLDANRKYLYLIDGAKAVTQNVAATNAIRNTFSNLVKGNGNGFKTKTITVTFAGSKMSGSELLKSSDPSASPITVPAFDPVNDYFQLTVSIAIPNPNSPALSGTYILQSIKFTRTGEWFTAKFEIPTKDEMIALYKAGSAVFPNLTRVSEEGIEQLYSSVPNPAITFTNISTRSTSGSDRFYRAPIILDKIELGLTD